MFKRNRNCLNPDCRESFDPINPHADCCSERCRNRKNYLMRKAKSFSDVKDSIKKIWVYMILKAQYDRRNRKQTREELEKLAVDFSVFSAPISFSSGDTKSTYCIGDLGLTLLKDNKTYMINKREIK